MADDLTFDLVAGSLRADSRDNASFLEVLATKLESALPGRVRVHRAGGLFRTSHAVTQLEVELGEDLYAVTAPAPGRLQARHSRVVRGIALKSEELDLAEWIDRLSHALVAEAARSEAAHEALQRLLT